MLGSRTLTSLLDQQTSVLRTQLGGVYDGTVDAVHNARVATRRIRELLSLVPVVPGRDSEEDVAESYKAIGRALGKVRDIDVQIALIHDMETRAPQTAPPLTLVRLEHERERLAKMRRLIKTLERLDVDVLLHVVTDGHPTGLRRRLTSTGWRQQLKRLVAERAHNAVDAMSHATGVYFPKRTHGARIAIKQLRYAAEIAEATGLSDMRAAIRTLKKGQEILGDLHDRQALSDTLQDYAKDDGADPHHVELTQQALEGEVLQLHAQYLTRRTSLREACSEVEHMASRVFRPAPTIAISALAVSGLLYAGVRSQAARVTES
jgi:CHAD domain-containing protein